METIKMTSEKFWRSDQPRVLFNSRDACAVEQAALIQAWSEQEPALSGHLLFASSGSSGDRKWVALSKEAILASAKMVNEHLSAVPSDHWLLALPDFHVGGMGVLARAYASACPVSLMPGAWDAQKFHALVADKKITLSSMVPTQLFDLVEAGLNAPESLRALLIGGGRLDDAIYQGAVDLGWPIIETYGMTESSSQIATSQVCGRNLHILPGWETRMTSDGRLSIKGRPLMSAYVQCHEGACEMVNPKVDGWLETNDVVEIDGDQIMVRGRADRCVKVLGELIHLSHVENQMIRWASKSGISVGPVGLPVVAVADERKGSRLVLCVSHHHDYRELVEGYNRDCHPVERIDQVLEVDEIPLSDLGKVLYAKLQEVVGQQS